MRNFKHGLRFGLASLLTLSLWATCLSVTPRTPYGDKDKLTAEQIVAKNLDSVGTAEVRAALKTMIMTGKVVSTLKVGGSGALEGLVSMASSGPRNLIGIQYQRSDYQNESMAYNGKSFSYGEITPGKYSELVKFMRRYDVPMREGLMGGILSISSPLWNTAGGKFKLKANGNKKIDGRDCYVVRYEGSNNNGMTVSLYFDAENFHHVRTEYERRQEQIGADQPGAPQKMGSAITKLTEEYSDFSAENGLTLPHTYKITLDVEQTSDRWLQEWVVTLEKFVFNKTLDDSEFVVGGVVKGKD